MQAEQLVDERPQKSEPIAIRMTASALAAAGLMTETTSGVLDVGLVPRSVAVGLFDSGIAIAALLVVSD